MKRVVVLSRRDITHYLSGGAGRYIHEILRRLTTRYSVTVLAEGGPKSKRVTEVDGITYRHFPGNFQRILLPARYVTKFAGLTDLLVDNADVGIPWLSPFYSKVPRIVVIYQVAGDIFHHELARPLSEVAIRLEPRLYRIYRNSEVVTCSPSTKNDLVRLGLSPERVSVIIPGIDDAFRRFEPDGHKFADPTVVCISRFRRYKGLGYAVSAMKYVLERSPRAKLIIMGNGDETEVKKEVQRTSYPDSIEILQRPPNSWNDEKRFILSRAHLLLIPSVREGYGIVVIEANACGTPAIGWSVAGVRDSIVDGKTGFLVPFGDTRALGETIAKYLEAQQPQRSSLSRNALEWARQHSWDKAAKEFEKTIETTLSRFH